MPNLTGHETKLNFGKKDDNSTMLQINLSMEIKFPRKTKRFSLQAFMEVSHQKSKQKMVQNFIKKNIYRIPFAIKTA
jgi:hypothetical protein